MARFLKRSTTPETEGFAELIQNRGFEDADIPPGFTLQDGFIVPPRTDHFWENRPVDWKLLWNVNSSHPAWSLTTSDASAATNAENSFDEPKKIVPVQSVLTGVAPTFSHALPPYSLSVMRLKTR